MTQSQYYMSNHEIYDVYPHLKEKSYGVKCSLNTSL